MVRRSMATNCWTTLPKSVSDAKPVHFMAPEIVDTAMLASKVIFFEP